MKHLCVFTNKETQARVAVRRFDIIGVIEIDRLSTKVTYSIFDGDGPAYGSIEVVGSFEETIEKVESCKL